MSIELAGIIIAIFGLLLSAIATLQGIVEITGSERGKRLALFAQEVLDKASDNRQTEYWTNTRDHSLKQVESHLAFPMRRKLFNLVSVGIGVALWFCSGIAWVFFFFEPVTAISMQLFALVGSLFLLEATPKIHTMETEQAKILHGFDLKQRIGYFYGRHFGLALIAHGIGALLILRAAESEPDHLSNSGLVMVAIVYLSTMVIGGMLLVYSLVNLKPPLQAWERSDARLLPLDESNEKPEKSPSLPQRCAELLRRLTSARPGQRTDKTGDDKGPAHEAKITG